MQDRIDALTGLRFFAALAIVVHHLNGVLWIPQATFEGVQLNQGVSFFFVLSGFILQHSYRSRIEQFSWAQLFSLRFFRVWPCHVAVLGLIMLANGKDFFAYYQHHGSAGQLLAAVFLLQSWNPDIQAVFLLNGPAWSLSTELFFYALFPLLCRLGLHAPFRPLFVGLLVTGFWMVVVSLFIPTTYFATLTGTFPLARLLEFTVGITLYEVISRQNGRWPRGSIFEAVAIALVFFAVWASTQLAHLVEYRLSVPMAWWIGSVGSTWAFALLIGIFFTSKGVFSRFAGWSPIVFLGEISFALYLVHQPLITFLAKPGTWFTGLAIGVQITLFIAVVLGLSAALHVLIEKPAMALAKRLVLRKRVQAGQGVV